MLFKSGLRKSQSCCLQSRFSAPRVSIASGHETHRIYAVDKEGGFHNAWWSASDTLPLSDLFTSRGENGEKCGHEMLKKIPNGHF